MSEERPPFCSVIVPTRDRPAHLAGCLSALRELDYPPERLELIVIDDVEGDGPAAARNRGAERAGGKLLAFTDVGNVYHEDQSIDFGRLRTAVGAELRIFLPIFQAPLRFIYSFNLDPKTPSDQFGFPITRLKERRSGFDFSIGRTF